VPGLFFCRRVDSDLLITRIYTFFTTLFARSASPRIKKK
jgi:hypothetical protein